MKLPSIPKIDTYSSNKNSVFLYLEEQKKLRRIAQEKGVSVTSARNYLYQ